MQLNIRQQLTLVVQVWVIWLKMLFVWLFENQKLESSMASLTKDEIQGYYFRESNIRAVLWKADLRNTAPFLKIGILQLKNIWIYFIIDFFFLNLSVKLKIALTNASDPLTPEYHPNHLQLRKSLFFSFYSHSRLYVVNLFWHK